MHPKLKDARNVRFSSMSYIKMPIFPHHLKFYNLNTLSKGGIYVDFGYESFVSLYIYTYDTYGRTQKVFECDYDLKCIELFQSLDKPSDLVFPKHPSVKRIRSQSI